MGNSINIGKYLGRKLAGITAPTSSIDPDAEAFITAANITDATQQTAIIQLVTDLKNYNLWNKAHAIYPFVGGTASSHMYNLKDPQNTNAAFRLSFSGGWTHSANGIEGNGINAFADTFLSPSTSFTTTSGHISIYSRTNSVANVYDFGASNATNEISANIRWAGDIYYVNYGALTYPFTTNTDSRGMYIVNRNSTTNTTGFKNGTSVINAAQTAALPNINVVLGGLRLNASVLNYSARQYAFASLGDGLSNTEAANFYTAVQAFQTTLGRQV